MSIRDTMFFTGSSLLLHQVPAKRSFLSLILSVILGYIPKLSNLSFLLVITVDSEFLRLDKSDFDSVLRRSYQQDWQSRFRDLRSLKSFGDWTDEELRVTNDRAKLIEFPPNTVSLQLVEQPYNYTLGVFLLMQ